MGLAVPKLAIPSLALRVPGHVVALDIQCLFGPNTPYACALPSAVIIPPPIVEYPKGFFDDDRDYHQD
jgi:hypothetical protein